MPLNPFRIRYRLLLVNVLVVAVPVCGIAFARMHERQLLVALERDMIHQAQLLRAALLADPNGLHLESRGPMLAASARDTRTRIRLLDARGALVADSHPGGPPLALAERREVRAALGGRYGAATRLWETQERVFLFVALPIVQRGEVDGVIYVTRSTQPVKAQLYRLRAWLATILVTSTVVTAVLSLFLAATISRPLMRLTRIAERIAAGERPAPLALARRDEIGQLARALDRMTGELDRRARDMRDLAADISHEFKSPLTGIRGAAELLRDGAADDPATRARFLAMILDDAARLDRLVTRLLELSRAESDDSAVEPVDLAALAAAVAERHGARVVGAATAPVSGRPRSLDAALDNLVANAVQHAAPGTEVTVTVGIEAGRARVAVLNHGAPLSPAVAARVWDRFFTTRADRGGSGLGLAIVRSVAAIHGGTVGVESGEGGTVFWIELSAHQLQPAFSQGSNRK